MNHTPLHPQSGHSNTQHTVLECDPMLCICCQSKFPKKLKGFKRWKVTTIMTRNTFTAVFQKPSNLFHTRAFICDLCHRIFVTKTVPCPCCSKRHFSKNKYFRKRRPHMRLLRPDVDINDVDVELDEEVEGESSTTSTVKKRLLTPGVDNMVQETGGESCSPSKRLKHLPEQVHGSLGKGIILGMHDYSKTSIPVDTNSKKACDSNSSTPNPQAMTEEGAKRAMMVNQRVQKIMKDPAMRTVLEQIQANPDTVKEHLQNPQTAADIQTLIDAGIIKSQSGPSRIQSGPSRIQSDDQSESAEVIDNPPSPDIEKPMTPKEKAISYFERSLYRLGFRQLCAHYPVAKREMLAVVQEMIRGEVKAMRQKKDAEVSFSKPVSIKNVETFKWDEVIDETKETMPVAVSCMTAMMPTTKRIKIMKQRTRGKIGGMNRTMSDDEAKAYFNRRLGQTLAISLFTNAPRKYNFVQKSMGIELYRQGATRKVFKMLNHSGVSAGLESTRVSVGALVRNHDHQLKEWKNKVEELLPKMKRFWKKEQRPTVPTFGLSVGRVHKWTQPHTPGQHGKNEAMCYAARDRIQNLTTSSKVVDAESLDPFVFLPSPDVIARQRLRLVDVVANIMSRHMKFLKHLSCDLPIAQEFKRSDAMSQRSETVTLGVVKADPGTREGMGSVLEHLQQYVPVIADKPMQILVNGDRLSVKRIRQVQKEKADGENWKDRLDTFYPAPQEFNKQVLLLQDSNNVFFRDESKTEQGTMAQVNKDFNYIGFRKEVTLCDAWNVQRSWDLYEFVTEGYTLLCALKFCGTSSLHETPTSFPTDGLKMEQLQWVQTVAQQVVDFVYHEPARSALKVAAEAYKDDKGEETEDALAYCHCKTEKDEEVVVCCSASCQKGLFHLSCVGLTAAPDDDWYCSAKCEDSPSYIYCVCKLKCDPEGDTRLVQCALQGNCKGHEWYHYRCIGLQLTDVLPEKWYCSEACSLDSENDDHVLNHSKALTLEGLRHLARRAAVRAGNGPIMVEDWKIDLLTFWSRKHLKYLVNAHQFLACVGGFAPSNIRTNLIWNRVINISGKPGENIGMDLASEFLTKEYRDTHEYRAWLVNEKRADYCAKMTGPLNQYLDTMFNDFGNIKTKIPKRTRSEKVYNQDVKSFIKKYQESALFEYLPFREHKSFKEFDGKDLLRDPRKLGQKLKALSRKMDTQRSVAQVFTSR